LTGWFFITETECAVRTEPLNIIRIDPDYLSPSLWPEVREVYIVRGNRFSDFRSRDIRI